MQMGKVPPLNLTNYNSMSEELMRQLFSISVTLSRAGASRQSLQQIERLGHSAFNTWLGRSVEKE
jgi:hypothetical protein